MTEKRFPVQQTHMADIPKEWAEEAYKEYSAQFGTQQSLERLGERAGFSWGELVMLLYQRIQRLEAKGKKLHS